MKKTICELFAGVGGFRLGLERSSNEWETVWANQWEPSRKSQWAFECYVENFTDGENKKEIYSRGEKNQEVNEWNNINISKVKDKAINKWSNVDIAEVNKKVEENQVEEEIVPNHSLLVGGFPCQDYSVARTQAEGIKGKKGVLWWEIEKIIRRKKPSFVLLENVNRLLKSPSSQRGRDFGVILSCLNNLGYIVEWRVINAADYGFPQKRKRVFIFASKLDNNYSKKIIKEDTKNILSEVGFFSSNFPVEEGKDQKTFSLEESKLFKDLVKVSDEFEFNFEDAGFMKNGIIYSADVTPIECENKRTLGDILEDEVDEKYFLSEDDGELDDWKYLKGAKAEERTSKSGHTYIYREGGMSFPDSLDKPARTILTSERTKSRSTHIVKDKKTGRLRKLTPIECERINQFPDNWTNTKTVSHAFRYFCMGNALVVGLIEKMGKKIIKIIENED